MRLAFFLKLMPRILVVALLAAGASLVSAKSYVAERFDVRVRVLPDASLMVTETVRFHFDGHFTYVARDVSKQQTDRIFDVRALMDGAPAAASVQESAPRVQVRWNFDTADSSHEFTLHYRVEGAIRKEPVRDVLQWNAIPHTHDYRIRAGEIAVEYPNRDALAGLPDVPRAASARHEALQSVFTLPALGEDRGVTAWVGFRPGFATQPPRWQQADELARKRWNTALGVAIPTAVIALLIGILAIVRFHGSIAPNREVKSRGTGSREEPSHLPPVVVATLIGRTGSAQGGLATLFDLAGRGVVAIRESERRRWGQRVYQIEPRDLHRPVLPFESALLQLAFGDLRSPKPVEFSAFMSKLSRSAGQVRESLQQHMIAAGLLDPERIEIRKSRLHIAWVVTVLGLLCGGVGLAVTNNAMRSGAPAALSVSAAIAGLGVGACVAGIVGLIVAASISPLSGHGAAAAGPWHGFRDKLADVARAKRSATPDDLERWLPLAIVFGLGSQWVKRCRKDGTVPSPAWFTGRKGGLAHLDFYHFVSHGHVAASGGGHGGGGGSGGGSSSAG